MPFDKTRDCVTVVAVGGDSVNFFDDVVTNTRHSLAAGTGKVLLGDEENGDWEPRPLPMRAAIDPGEQGEGWRPDELALRPGDMEIVAPNAKALEVPADAFEKLRSGNTVTVRLLSTGEVNLSELSGLTEAARSTPGRVVVELHGDA